MIYITQLIYIRDGKEQVFNQFEDVAMPLIPRYNGTLLFRLRPHERDFIEHAMPLPYEVHFISFPSTGDLEKFMKDETRKQFLHLKEESISSSLIVRGEKL